MNIKTIIIAGVSLLYATVYSASAQSISALPLVNTSVCEGSTLNVSFAINGSFNAGNSFSAELSDNLGSFASSTAIGVLVGTTSGTIAATIPLGTAAGNGYKIHIKSTNPSVISNDLNITINSIPTVTFAPLANVCINSSALVLSGGSPSGGVNSYSGVGVFNGSFYPNLSGAGNFVLTYSYQDANGCLNTSNATITVNPLPVVSLTPFTPLCLNDAPIAISGGNPIGGTYTIDGNIATTIDPAFVGPGNHSIQYNYTDAITLCSGSASQFLNINIPPTISYNLPASVCLNSNINLNFSPSGGVLTVNGIPATNNSTYNAAVAGNLTIVYSYTDISTNCTSVVNSTVIVNNLPAVSIPASATLCQSAGAVVLTGGSPIGGVYSGVGVLNDSLFYSSLIGATSTTINYTYTDGNNCSNSASQLITLDPAPIVSIVAPGIVCLDGGVVNLVGNPAGGTFTGVGIVGNGFNPSTSGLGTFNITYSYTNANNCSASISQTITVTNGSQPIISSIAPLCVNNLPVVITTTPIGGTISGAGVVGGSFDASIAGVGNHAIYYQVTFANGCIGYDTINVIVNALPNVNFVAPTNVCINASVITLNGGLPVGGSYSGDGVSGLIFAPIVAGIGVHTLTYNYTDLNGCSAAANHDITVNDIPVVTLNTFQPVCNGTAAFNLVGGLPAGGTYFGNGVIGGNQFDPTLNGPGNFQITYSYTDANGCINTAAENINVSNLTVDAGLNQSISCGASGQLNASINYSGTNTVTYSWTPAAGLSNTGIPNPVANGNITTTYYVTVSDGICSATDSVTISYIAPSFGISFTASPIAFIPPQLPPYVVNFTNPYYNSGYNFTYIFGDGFTQFNNAQNFPHTYFNNGVYTVLMIAQDLATGCIDTIPASFTINITGNTCGANVSINEVGPIIGCTGAPVLLTTTNNPNAVYQWYFNGGVIGGANTSSYNCYYNGAQTSYSGYYSVLVEDTAAGCISMSNIVQVIFNQPPPPPAITILDGFVPCLGDSATLGVNPIYATYNWTRLISTTSLGNQPTQVVTQTGVYQVTITDNNGCSASAITSINNFGPDPSSICFVTVDSLAQLNNVYWENPINLPNQLQSFLLLRKSDIQYGFDTIAEIPYNDVAAYYLFQDNDLISLPTYGGNINNLTDPAIHYYTYGLALKDTCGGTSIPTLYQSTINITSSTANGGASWDLSWNPYGGLPFLTFELHRSDINNIDTVINYFSSSVFSFTVAATPLSLAYPFVDYWITVPLDAGCDTTRAASVKSRSNVVKHGLSVGMKENIMTKNILINVNPNPNNGNFEVVIKANKSEPIIIDIIDILGNVVYTKKMNTTVGKTSNRFDLPELNQGIYQFRLQSQTETKVQKLMINK